MARSFRYSLCIFNVSHKDGFINLICHVLRCVLNLKNVSDQPSPLSLIKRIVKKGVHTNQFLGRRMPFFSLFPDSVNPVSHIFRHSPSRKIPDNNQEVPFASVSEDFLPPYRSGIRSMPAETHSRLPSRCSTMPASTE